MNTQNWLSLVEYSATYRVSLSTLRRRIKSGEIDFKLIEGKYLIRVSQSGSETIAPPPQVSSQNQTATSQSPRSVTAVPPTPAPAAPVSLDPDQYWTATQALLAELKKAFAQALATKDEQIVLLRDEVANLKMLVEVLESETQRLKASPALTFDLGLEA